jgi:diguanylate cyclase (GGDEF)-like protein
MPYVGYPAAEWQTMTGPSVVKHRALVPAAVTLVLGFALFLRVRPGGDSVIEAVDDIGECIAAAVAAACCAWRASRSTGRYRLSWLLLTGATGGWALGEAMWSYYEVLSNRATPFPSLADVGFLAFPALALPALLVRPSAAFSGSGRPRLVLDGTMVAASLFNVSWATSLGAVYRAGGDSTAGTIVGLAYPASDLVILTVAILVLVQAQVRSGLVAFSAGLLAMAVADSAFSYLTAAGKYHTGSYIDIAWVAAFVLIGLSALSADVEDTRPVKANLSPTYLVLPYALVAVGIAAAIVSIIQHQADHVALLVAAIVVAAVLVRQFLTLIDNRRLVRDVEAHRDELRHYAFHDALTGLANRSLFYDRVQHALDLHRRDLRPVSMVFCDLDDFKAVNDTLGHAAGDALLVAIAERLRATIRPGDTVARLGGDEFAILVEDDGDATALAARLLDAFTIPVRISGREIPVRASIGLTSVDPADPPIDGEELIRRGDVAMYRAKRSGKATVVAYSRVMSDEHNNDLDLKLALVDDIATGRIRTALQPIVRITGGAYAYEALARWTYQGVPVPPSIFIPIADRAGMLLDLDLLMIRNAVRWASSCADDSILVTVNIGVTNLPDPGLPVRIARLLHDYGLPPERLVVEIPEDHAMDDDAIPRTLATFRSLGVKLALDDFGVGYSSLSRIGRLRPEIIKLDRSFVVPLDEPGAPKEVLGGIIDLAHRLGAVVVAEGVETDRQFAVLAELGCDAIQGFLLGRPSELDLVDDPAPAVRVTELPSEVRRRPGMRPGELDTLF